LETLSLTVVKYQAQLDTNVSVSRFVVKKISTYFPLKNRNNTNEHASREDLSLLKQTLFMEKGPCYLYLRHRFPLFA